MDDNGNRPTLAQALHALLAVCDGAQSRDNAGFNGEHARIARELAAQGASSWTLGQRTYIYSRMLPIYRKQLARLGVDYDAIPNPAAEVEAEPEVAEMAVKNGLLWITFPKVPRLVEAMRSVKFDADARFTTDGGAHWEVQPHKARALRPFAEAYFSPASLAAWRTLIESPEAAKPAIRFEAAGRDGIKVSFPYDQELVRSVKALGGARWNPDTKAWTVSMQTPQRLDALVGWAESHGATIPEDVLAEVVAVHAHAHRNLRDAAALDTDEEIEVPGIAFPLRPFQKAGVVYLSRNPRAMLADQMGLGKTVQSLATVVAAGALPMVVVCPASLKYNWQAEVRKWFPALTTQVLAGRKPNGEQPGADVVIINYDILGGWVERLVEWGPKSVVVDEAHYVKHEKSARSKAASVLAKAPSVERFYMLTGTPVENRPRELVVPLQMMGHMSSFGTVGRFLYRYCGPEDNGWGTTFNGHSNEQELSEKLASLGFLRRKTADVYTELPPITRSTLPVDLSAAEQREYNAEVERFAEAVARKQWARELDGLQRQEEMPEEWETSAIAHLGRCREIAARGKLAAVRQWVEDFQEQNDTKLLIFAYHREVQQAIASWFVPGTSVFMSGDEHGAARQALVDEFQENPAVRVGVLSLKAMSVGVTLTEAHHVLFVELDWKPSTHDQAEARAYGRVNDPHPVTAYYMLAQGTVDEYIWAMLEEKRAVADAIHDGHRDADVDGQAIVIRKYTEAMAEAVARKVAALQAKSKAPTKRRVSR